MWSKPKRKSKEGLVRLAFNEIYNSVLKSYPDVLSVDEMCDALSVSTKTGYRLIRENKVQHIKIGRSYRVPKAHLLAYMRVLATADTN